MSPHRNNPKEKARWLMCVPNNITREQLTILYFHYGKNILILKIIIC